MTWVSHRLGAAGRLSIAAALAAATADADQLSCAFPEGPEITFAIDRDQFAPALDPGDPPRRKVTRVQLGLQSLVAEPILMEGGVRGFWTDDPLTGTHVLTARPDGRAIYTGPGGSSYDGMCEDVG